MTAMLGDTRVKIVLYLLLIFEKLWFRFSSKFRNLYLYIWFIEKKKNEMIIPWTFIIHFILIQRLNSGKRVIEWIELILLS